MGMITKMGMVEDVEMEMEDTEMVGGIETTTMVMETKGVMRVELELLPGNDLTAYTQKFQVLILLCPKMVPEEEDQVERRPDVARAYKAESNEKSRYAGSYPYCNKYRLHHVGPCTVKCTNCKKTSHMARDCKNQAAATNQRVPVYSQRTPVNIRELQ
ncbi:putative reverse transcriptase domain-containing protein [Tanacetum coccineum]